MAILISTNPAKNYEKIGSVKVSTPGEIKKKVVAAQKAKEEWKKLGVEKRAAMLRPLYDIYRKRKKEIALLVTREIGKPISESLGDLEWDKDYLQDFLQNGTRYLQDEITHRSKQVTHRTIFEPYGVAAVIVPWNFPFANFLWGVIPNLIVGNTVIFKHSEECPLSGKLYEEIMAELKLPKGVFAEAYGDGKTGEYLVKQDIDLIWFTGSSAAGKKLYELAGRKFIKACLELGGSNPGVIFPDTPIDDNLMTSLFFKRFNNNGQVCDAIKRLIVHQSIFNQLANKLADYLSKEARVGNPEDGKTNLGSLVAKRQLELLESQVKDAVQKGAKIITGGKRPDRLQGAYYLPTILTGIKRNMRVWKEEAFGPVLPVIAFKTEEEAIKLANDTPYGLGAVVWSKNIKRAYRVASQIEAGDIDINAGNHWMPGTPFGGYKFSGIGREHGRIGFQELCQVKVIAEG